MVDIQKSEKPLTRKERELLDIFRRMPKTDQDGLLEQLWDWVALDLASRRIKWQSKQ